MEITGPPSCAAPLLVAAKYAGVNVTYSAGAEPVSLTTESGTISGLGAVLRCDLALAPRCFLGGTANRAHRATCAVTWDG